MAPSANFEGHVVTGVNLKIAFIYADIYSAINSVLLTVEP
jgi:hypothetical protein